jgi:predicted nucleotidyltransferase component of viral defense system
MIKREIIDFIVRKKGIKNIELLEKDLLLTQLLYYLSKEKIFFDNYAFKGGTCLIKCYLGYYRFSEDMDFTYVKQDKFEGKSQKKIREIISSKIDSIADTLEKLAKEVGLRFKAEKHNKEYFQYGGSNAFVTFKLWYKSEVAERETFIKVQINHIEKLDYPIKEIKAKSVISNDIKEEFALQFSKDAEMLVEPINIKTYDLKEILVEKIRAILTRRGVKARDFIDVYKILKEDNVKLSSLSGKIIDKTEAMLKFEKYSLNLEGKQESGFNFEIGEEEKMLLTPLGEDFNKFLVEFKAFLQELTGKFKVENKS